MSNFLIQNRKVCFDNQEIETITSDEILSFMFSIKMKNRGAFFWPPRFKEYFRYSSALWNLHYCKVIAAMLQFK